MKSCRGRGKPTFQFSGGEKDVLIDFGKLDAVAIEVLIGKDMLQNSSEVTFSCCFG